MSDEINSDNKNDEPARDWATGTYATAATKAALIALITGEFPDPVGIILSSGEVPYFLLCYEGLGDGYAMAGIEMSGETQAGKSIIATVYPAPHLTGVEFHAGDGVASLASGAVSIDTETRSMISEICDDICTEYGLPSDLVVTISIPGATNIAIQCEADD